jgi:hypothetical protein
MTLADRQNDRIGGHIAGEHPGSLTGAAPGSPAMCGSATFAIEVSKTSMNAAKATVAAISHGFDFGFHCVQSQPSAFILILPIGFV